MTNAFSSTDSSEALVDIVALYDLFDAKNYEIWVVHPYDPKSDYKIDIHEPIVYSKKQEDVIDTTVHVKKEDYEIINGDVANDFSGHFDLFLA